MPTDRHTLLQVKYVLVAVRLTILTSPDETQRLYYSKTPMGQMRPVSVVYMASEIYAIFYGTRIQGIVF